MPPTPVWQENHHFSPVASMEATQLSITTLSARKLPLIMIISLITVTATRICLLFPSLPPASRLWKTLFIFWKPISIACVLSQSGTTLLQQRTATRHWFTSHFWKRMDLLFRPSLTTGLLPLTNLAQWLTYLFRTDQVVSLDLASRPLWYGLITTLLHIFSLWTLSSSSPIQRATSLEGTYYNIGLFCEFSLTFRAAFLVTYLDVHCSFNLPSHGSMYPLYSIMLIQ